VIYSAFSQIQKSARALPANGMADCAWHSLSKKVSICLVILFSQQVVVLLLVAVGFCYHFRHLKHWRVKACMPSMRSCSAAYASVVSHRKTCKPRCALQRRVCKCRFVSENLYTPLVQLQRRVCQCCFAPEDLHTPLVQRRVCKCCFAPENLHTPFVQLQSRALPTRSLHGGH
jgi:hypothetical protein